ncbi:MAG: BREX system P-loop protein BrxC [Deltaproteobacteria bacterium]|nr:BREX system P-loop protein BrxC [Deltaproteobacteria bacterium]
MKIKDLFESDVTRDIPPVVYFHEQSPEKLADEVKEYIVTGGWPEEHPNHRRVPKGIHEEYVDLLKAITVELDKKGGTDLPNAWISGFYGSGKSSFAKLLGLALDGKPLPGGKSLADAWLKRDTSPRAKELHDAWAKLRQKVDPIAVVFDVGARARDNEQIHSVIVREVQKRLGYCSTDPIVAKFELDMERDGEWKRFEATAEKVLKKPWASVKDRALAEEDFSAVMHALQPERYSDAMAWYTSRAGMHGGVGSPEDAVAAIRDMLKFRKPDATLFLVVDEVSQYVLGNKDRVDRLRAFATALGATLKGKVWLLALGQQKLDEDADDSFLLWAKDRFPQKLRVHLAPTNIRDVVHKRLLSKKDDRGAELRALFEKSRTDLKLFAYGCDSITAEDFVEVYPLLPGHIDLLLQITTALRTRSTRAQGDDQAIRGLLQLLGELFRDQKLAEADVGALITFDKIYEVQHTALDSDAQASMARILDQCSSDASGLLVSVAKAVALLELIQEHTPTDARFVAQVLYDRLDRGSNVQQVQDALEDLRRRNLLGYSEKHGYKLQSSAGEEWEGERRDMGAPREAIGEVVQEALKLLLAAPEKPKLDGRPFSWEGVFSDGRKADNAVLTESRDDATVKVDFRLLTLAERGDNIWVKRSAETAFESILLWIAGDNQDLDERAKELVKSRAMVKKYKPRRESMNAARKMLLQQEENRAEELENTIKAAVGAAWLAGKVYFRGEALDPKSFGSSFVTALHAVATKKLPDIYNRFIASTVAPSELMQLLEPELSGPSPKFLNTELGLLEMDAGRYVPTCAGVVPQRILEFITDEDGVGGTTLLAKFGGPPYGYPPNVVKACVAGLLRAGKLRISPESGDDIARVRDAGARDLFDKDRGFKRANFYPAGDDSIGYPTRAKICKFFEDQLKHKMDREDDHIAEAVQHHFPLLAGRTRDVLDRHSRMPGRPKPPDVLVKLQTAIEACLRNVRSTLPTVKAVKSHLDALGDGVQLLNMYDAELTSDVVQRMSALADVRDHQAAQLFDIGGVDDSVASAITALRDHLSRERPWRTVAESEASAAIVSAAYAKERTHLLERQEELANKARSRVKTRDGFSTLTADQSNHVLRPISEAQTDTTAEAIAPPLSKLKDGFDVRLQKAEDDAIERLDELRAQKVSGATLVVKVDLGLKNRELASIADIDALLAEIRERLLKQLDETAQSKGTRVRIL